MPITPEILDEIPKDYEKPTTVNTAKNKIIEIGFYVIPSSADRILSRLMQ